MLHTSVVLEDQDSQCMFVKNVKEGKDERDDRLSVSFFFNLTHSSLQFMYDVFSSGKAT